MQTCNPRFWALAAIVLLSACNGTNKKTDKKTNEKKVVDTKVYTVSGIPTRLEGTWECVRDETNMASALSRVGVIYIFKDSTLKLMEVFGTTKVTDTSFIFKWDGDDVIESYHYSFKGDSLLISDLASYTTGIRYFVKK